MRFEGFNALAHRSVAKRIDDAPKQLFARGTLASSLVSRIS